MYILYIKKNNISITLIKNDVYFAKIYQLAKTQHIFYLFTQ